MGETDKKGYLFLYNDQDTDFTDSNYWLNKDFLSFEDMCKQVGNNNKTYIDDWKCSQFFNQIEKELKENREIEAYILKIGAEPKGIFGHGIIKRIYEKNEGNKWVDISLDCVLNYNQEKILSLDKIKPYLEALSIPKKDKEIFVRRSAVPVTNLKLLNELWEEHLKNLGKVQLNQEKKNMNENTKNSNTQIKDLNIILYGPPGTGKTYYTALYAIAISEEKPLKEIEVEAKLNYDVLIKRYRELIKGGKIAFTTFHQSYGYEEFIEGIKPVLSKTARRGRNNRRSGEISYELADGVFKEFCERARDDKDNNYVFIIDEINRGNIAKIFGELITLIEDTKREGKPEAATAILPYSKESFSVPSNVYVIGTMNTADRSIMQLDTALRRRFRFVEMMPEPSLLKDINIYDEKQADKGINLALMLETMNKRIEALYDREHTVGHSYFMKLNKDSNIKDLAEIFKKDILPLLQEYFYEDYEKIQMVLGDNAKSSNDYKFIIDKTMEFKDVFQSNQKDLESELPPKKYSVNTAPYEEYKFYEYLQDKLDKGNNDENRES